MRDALNWFLLYTKPRQEQVALVNLQRQGYETFHPRIKVQKIHEGKHKLAEEALFPSYIFIRLGNMVQNWLPIKSTYGVSKIVRFGQFPAEVSECMIESIRAKVQQRKIIAENKSFNPGQHVVVQHGPMQGIEAIFHSYSSKKRVLLLLEMLGQQACVNVAVDDVIAAF